MQYFVGLAALAAVAIAAPAELVQRQTACAAATTTVLTLATGTATVTGPFKVSAAVAPTATIGQSSNGKFAKYVAGFGTGTTYGNVVFGASHGSGATLYLDSSGDLFSVVNETAQIAYNYNYKGKIPHVAIDGTTPGNAITCSIASSCALDCINAGDTYNCLSSPGYEPDWSINTGAKKAGNNCIPFQPYITTP